MPRISRAGATCALAVCTLGSVTAAQASYTPTLVDSVTIAGWNYGYGAISPDGHYGYFGAQNATGGQPGRVTKVDLSTMTMVGTALTLNSGEFVPGHMAVSPDGSTLVVGVGDNSHAPSLVKIATSSMTETGAVALPSATTRTPGGVAVSPNGAYAFVGNGAYPGQGKVWKVLLSDMSIAAGPVNVGGSNDAGTYTMAIAPDGNSLYAAAGYTGVIYQVSTSTLATQGSIAGTVQYPSAIVVSPNGNDAYVTDNSGTTTASAAKFNLGTMQQVGTATTFTASQWGVFGLAIAPDGSEIYTADQSGPIKVTPLSTAAMTVDPGTTVGNGSSYSYDVVASPQGQYIYVSDVGPNPAKVYRVQVATSNTLTVTKSGTGTGSVVGSHNWIDCGSTCSTTLGATAAVTLAATADSGSEFEGWEGACSGTTPTCEISMGATRVVTAKFKKPAADSGGASTPTAPGGSAEPAASGGSSTATTDAVTLPASALAAGLRVTAQGQVTLPLHCPAIPGGCDANGTLSARLPSNVLQATNALFVAHASTNQVLARFSGVHIASGTTRLYTVRLDPVTYGRLRARGIRRVRAALYTVNRLSGGDPVVSRQYVWLRIAATRRAAVTG